MSVDLADIEKKALKLPAQERAALAQRLIISLDDTDAAEIERLWLEEAERRYQEYKKGHIASRPAAEVFRDAFARFS